MVLQISISITRNTALATFIAFTRDSEAETVFSDGIQCLASFKFGRIWRSHLVTFGDQIWQPLGPWLQDRIIAQKYNIPLIFHTYFIHVPYVFHAFSVHIPCVLESVWNMYGICLRHTRVIP